MYQEKGKILQKKKLGRQLWAMYILCPWKRDLWGTGTAGTAVNNDTAVNFGPGDPGGINANTGTAGTLGTTCTAGIAGNTDNTGTAVGNAVTHPTIGLTLLFTTA